MKRFSDIVNISSDINHASTGNQVRGVLIRKEENVTLPSGRTLFRRRKEGENTMLIGVTQLVAEFLTGKRTNKIEVLTLDKDLESTITATSSIVKNDLPNSFILKVNIYSATSPEWLMLRIGFNFFRNSSNESPTISHSSSSLS